MCVCCDPCGSVVLDGNFKPFVNGGLWGKVIRGQWTTGEGFGLFCIDFRLLSCLCCHGMDATCHQAIARYDDSCIVWRKVYNTRDMDESRRFLLVMFVLDELYKPRDHLIWVICFLLRPAYVVVLSERPLWLPLHFISLMRSRFNPLPLVKWTVIYFTAPFGWSSTSLWSTFQHLHKALETSVDWSVCPPGAKRSVLGPFH